MSDSGDGMGSGDYDNETAGLEAKLLARKLEQVDAEAPAEIAADGSESRVDEWEDDGGRR